MLYNQTKIKRVQRLINIKIAKAFRHISHEALCILTGPYSDPHKMAELYYIKGRKTFRNQRIDTTLGDKDCRHPADTIQIHPVIPGKAQTLTAYTDGSKTE